MLVDAGAGEAVALEMPVFSALEKAKANLHVPRIPPTVAYDPGAAGVGKGEVREEEEDLIPPPPEERYDPPF